VALSEVDRELLQDCLARQPNSWEAFVDRFLGMVVHVIRHTAETRSFHLPPADVEDLAADVFVAIVENDFAVLRRFRGESSLATYLTVIARRVVVRELLQRRTIATASSSGLNEVADQNLAAEERIDNRDEITRLLDELNGNEADIVRMYHLEGKTYHEISDEVGIPENTIGPVLSRARSKLRRVGANSPAS
jgi:RNA polymerase sigma-70 factor (ECF subfamily)